MPVEAPLSVAGAAQGGFRYRPITQQNMARQPFWARLSRDQREALAVVSRVLPFRTNGYVVDELIDWDRVPDDPMFQLTFVQRDMLAAESYQALRERLHQGAPEAEVAALVDRIRRGLKPHPGGQVTHNVPSLDGRPLPGLQHKYDQTVLFFPAPGQTCHAYCTYCFRWAQFVDLPDLKFSARETDDLVAYLEVHREVSDVLITGGDPLIMKASTLRRYLEPLLSDRLSHVRNIRIGTKALSYWPQRLVSDPDADELLRLFEQVVASGRQLALMLHYSHPVELRPSVARQALARARATGAELRFQAPLVRHVNDRAETWAELLDTVVPLGVVPYYMFVERDTGPRNYFEVPLVRAHEIFRDAYRQVSGLARTIRGPSMSAFPGKVRVLGVTEIGAPGEEEPCFVLDFLQARSSDWVRRPFFARFDPQATWLDQLRPARGEARFFFQD